MWGFFLFCCWTIKEAVTSTFVELLKNCLFLKLVWSYVLFLGQMIYLIFGINFVIHMQHLNAVTKSMQMALIGSCYCTEYFNGHANHCLTKQESDNSYHKFFMISLSKNNGLIFKHHYNWFCHSAEWPC